MRTRTGQALQGLMAGRFPRQGVKPRKQCNTGTWGAELRHQAGACMAAKVSRCRGPLDLESLSTSALNEIGTRVKLSLEDRATQEAQLETSVA